MSRLGSYKGTSLVYDVLCDPYSSEYEDKAEDKIIGNCTANQKIYIENIDKLLMSYVHTDTKTSQQ